MSYEKVTLENFAYGALEEKLQYELKKVKDNIADINTEFSKPREIIIKIKLLPNEERNTILHETSIVTKLAPIKSSVGSLRLANQKGQLDLFQETSRDQELFKNLDVKDPENEREINIKEVINQ